MRDWALDCRITHFALSKLLKILKPKHDELPIDARTLLNTPKKNEIRNLPSGGLYWDAGLIKNLTEICKYKDCPKKLVLEFSIDGLPISKTSQVQFWPIQCSILNVNIRPFFVGIFCGESKPASLDEYVEPFINECGLAINEGIKINGKMYRVEFDRMVADAQARAYLKCIKGHSGYYSCERCTVEGKYYRSTKHVCLVETNAPLRTDESFRAQEQEEHHHSHSPFERLPIDMIRAFPLDYLHLVLLGVMKTLLCFWRKGTSKYTTKFTSVDIKGISEKLERAAKSKPSDINRAIRPFNTVGDWTGTEFRTFLLKTGPVVLKDHLPIDAYNHFLALHCAITICTTESLLIYKDVAEALLLEFVTRVGEIYGDDAYRYNFHSLEHIVDDVRQFGVLDAQSAFKYESNLGVLKRLLRSGNKPLQQAANRIQERQIHELTKPNFEPKYPVLKKFIKYQNIWKVLQFKDFNLDSSERNCWILTKDKDIFRVEHFFESENIISVFGKRFKNEYATNLYDLPLPSSHLSIFKIKLVNADTKILSLQQIDCKLYRIEIDEVESAFFPLFHTQSSMKTTSSDGMDFEVIFSLFPIEIFFLLHFLTV